MALTGKQPQTPVVDLHSHTDRSDGLLSPAGLLRRAADQGVELLAITDHDTTAGVAEAEAAAREVGVQLLPGVEVSVSWGEHVLHVLGLGVDPDSTGLRAGLARHEEMRRRRAEQMAGQLDGAGVTGSLAGAQAQAGDGVPGRTHFARFLVSAGHARDLPHAFRRFLGQGRPGYAATDWAPLGEVIEWIHGAGGRSVLAHPARYRLSASGFRRMLDAFRSAGGMGLEVVSGLQPPELTARLAAQARTFGLLASVGSDFHAPGAGRELGQTAPLPPECTPVWLDWLPG